MRFARSLPKATFHVFNCRLPRIYRLGSSRHKKRKEIEFSMDPSPGTGKQPSGGGELTRTVTPGPDLVADAILRMLGWQAKPEGTNLGRGRRLRGPWSRFSPALDLDWDTLTGPRIISTPHWLTPTTTHLHMTHHTYTRRRALGPWSSSSPIPLVIPQPVAQQVLPCCQPALPCPEFPHSGPSTITLPPSFLLSLLDGKR